MLQDLPTRSDALYERVRRVVPPAEWRLFEDDVEAILRLKRERNAVILAHNYQTPEIFHCVSDIVGDSLALAREAQTVDAEIIVMAGVHFMAETAKLMNPTKRVLIPDPAGRLLARREHHRRRRAAAARALSRRAGGDLRQHLGGGEGGERHLLHVGQCPARGGEPGQRPGDHDPRRVSRAEHRQRDRHQDDHLGRPLRGARALHAGRDPPPARRQSRHHRAGASGVPAGGGRRSRLCRLHRRDVGLCRQWPRVPRGADHRVLDERQTSPCSIPTSISSGPATCART